jgi:hypothetical protein
MGPELSRASIDGTGPYVPWKGIKSLDLRVGL